MNDNHRFLRRLHMEIVEPIWEIYQRLQNTFNISNRLDTQELYDTVWSIARDIHVYGPRPVTKEEHAAITKAHREACLELHDYVTRRRPQAIAAIVAKIKEDFEIKDDVTDDELTRVITDIATTAYEDCRDLTMEEEVRIDRAHLEAFRRRYDWLDNLNHNLSNVFNLSL